MFTEMCRVYTGRKQSHWLTSAIQTCVAQQSSEHLEVIHFGVGADSRPYLNTLLCVWLSLSASGYFHLENSVGIIQCILYDAHWKCTFHK